MGCPRHVVHASRAGLTMAIASAHRDWAVHEEVALSASRSGVPGIGTPDQQNCPALPDVVGGAEAGGLPAQPGQQEPPLTLHPRQLSVTQHLLHQLLVPPDACSCILWRKGGSDKSHLGPDLGSQPAQGLLPRQEQRGQGTAPWPGAASLGIVMPSFGELEGNVAVAALQTGTLGMSPTCGAATLLPVSQPVRWCSAAPGCSAAAAPMPASGWL